MQRKLTAEFLGTLWLGFGSCGNAVLAAAFPAVGIGLLGVSFAFGLTMLTMAYSIGHVSGCHLNPAVTLGMVAAGKFEASEAPDYIVAEVLGAIPGAAILFVIASGKPGFETGGFAWNGFGALSPGKYELVAAFVCEAVLTGVFLVVILGAASTRAPPGFAPIAIERCLMLIHLISVPVANTSVNPARSTGVVLFAGGEYIAQLWLFWVAPILGAVVGGIVHKYLNTEAAVLAAAE